MKTFIYGLVLGAAGAYLWIAHGAVADATLTSMLGWRSSAQSSVYGYGGAPAPKR